MLLTDVTCEGYMYAQEYGKQKEAACSNRVGVTNIPREFGTKKKLLLKDMKCEGYTWGSSGRKRWSYT